MKDVKQLKDAQGGTCHRISQVPRTSNNEHGQHKEAVDEKHSPHRGWCSALYANQGSCHTAFNIKECRMGKNIREEVFQRRHEWMIVFLIQDLENFELAAEMGRLLVVNLPDAPGSQEQQN
jgi:hypothetical protein